jgi:hypothetical protein
VGWVGTVAGDPGVGVFLTLEVTLAKRQIEGPCCSTENVHMQLNMICSESTPSDRLLMPGLSCPLTADADKSTIRSRTLFEHDILLDMCLNTFLSCLFYFHASRTSLLWRGDTCFCKGWTEMGAIRPTQRSAQARQPKTIQNTSTVIKFLRLGDQPSLGLQNNPVT